MIRHLLITTAAVACLASSVAAQDRSDEPGGQAAVAPRSDAHLGLARRYIDLSQGDAKAMENAFRASFGDLSVLEPDQREFLTRQGAAALTQAMQRYFAEIVPVVADIYTEDELEALVTFKETPVGRSIAGKDLEFGMRAEQIVSPLIHEAMTGLMTKYCARFDCEAPTASKPAG